MKNNNKSRKLTLNRETIASLQSDQLAEVNGGATPVFTVSLLAPPVTSHGASHSPLAAPSAVP